MDSAAVETKCKILCLFYSKISELRMNIHDFLQYVSLQNTIILLLQFTDMSSPMQLDPQQMLAQLRQRHGQSLAPSESHLSFIPETLKGNVLLMSAQPLRQDVMTTIFLGFSHCKLHHRYVEVGCGTVAKEARCSTIQ